MACPTVLQQVPFTDLPGHILEDIVSCSSLTTLGRLEICHRTLTPYCERSQLWAPGVAAIVAVNKSSDGIEAERTVGLIPGMDALRALDPRTVTGYEALTPRQQFLQLAQYSTTCMGNLAAALSQYMPESSEGSFSRFERYATCTSGRMHRTLPMDPRWEALEALEAADPERFRRMLDLMFLSAAREELACGPDEFAAVFAGLPLESTEMWKMGGIKVSSDESASAHARTAVFGHLVETLVETLPPVHRWNCVYDARVTTYLQRQFSVRSPGGEWRDPEGLILGGDRHMERLLEPVGPAVLLGYALVK